MPQIRAHTAQAGAGRKITAKAGSPCTHCKTVKGTIPERIDYSGYLCVPCYREQVVAREAEIERLRKDAERYRWLQFAIIKRINFFVPGLPIFVLKAHNKEEFDAAIDAAIAAQNTRPTPPTP